MGGIGRGGRGGVEVAVGIESGQDTRMQPCRQRKMMKRNEGEI